VVTPRGAHEQRLVGTKASPITSGHLHIEWATPAAVKGHGQGRGNSGVFIEGIPELQVLDSFNNPTYFDGQAIMRGLPAAWMHTQDELYNRLRGPAKNVTVLASAISDVTHEPQPILMAISYGRGRVFHTTLGHYREAMKGLGFQLTLARGTEWAATGKVTLPAPTPGELSAGPRATARALPAIR
jgi:hypothetical protein